MSSRQYGQTAVSFTLHYLRRPPAIPAARRHREKPGATLGKIGAPASARPRAFEYNRISIPAEKELVEELSAVRYRLTDRGQMQMLKKDDIKRIIGRSPDYVDALSLLWESGTYFGGDACVPAVRSSRPEDRW
jgi:hypothetical protein